jgi:hypothetical protein
MVKLRYKGECISVEISAHDMDDEASMSEFIERLVHPLLLGVGYAPTLVERITLSAEED